MDGLNNRRVSGLIIKAHPLSELEKMSTLERITRNPSIMGGKPCIHGTRITVEHILRKLGEGLTIEQLLADHPRLNLEDICASERFAADYLTN